MTGDRRFRRHDRLCRKADYDRVFARRRSARGRYLVVHGCENTLGRPRLGRVVGKRWGSAVRRNRVRRWIREAFRQIKASLSALDLVVMPLTTEGICYQLVEQELLWVVNHLSEKLKLGK